MSIFIHGVAIDPQPLDSLAADLTRRYETLELGQVEVVCVYK